MPSFNLIPANTRTPGFFAEVDGSQAGQSAQTLRTLAVGLMTSAGSATADVAVRVRTASEAKALFGAGSALALMCAAILANDPFGELWGLPQAEDGAGVQASGTITVSGPATADGTISLYIGGQLVQVAVSSGDSANTIAAAIDAAVTAATDLPVTSGVAAAVVTLTAKHKALIGNEIDLRDSYLGAAGGEQLPAGVGLAYVAMAAGTTAPSLSASITAIASEDFEFIAHCYTDATSLSALEADLADTAAGRWGPLRALYGHAVCAKSDTVGGLTTLGNSRNSGHSTIIGTTGHPTTPWEIAAAATGQIAASVRVHPARPFQTLALIGVLAPAAADRQTQTDRQTLLTDGIATLFVNRAGKVRLERVITTYQLDGSGNPDTAMLDANTSFTNAYLLRDLSGRITSKYGRHILVNDGTRYNAGLAVVTPAVVRGEILSAYRAWEALALVENFDLFNQYLTVERPASDPNRLDVLLPPDLANQARVFAVLSQFRLQFPASA